MGKRDVNGRYWYQDWCVYRAGNGWNCDRYPAYVFTGQPKKREFFPTRKAAEWYVMFGAGAKK